jgi:hypothetical protein
MPWAVPPRRRQRQRQRQTTCAMVVEGHTDTRSVGRASLLSLASRWCCGDEGQRVDQRQGAGEGRSAEARSLSQGLIGPAVLLRSFLS